MKWKRKIQCVTIAIILSMAMFILTMAAEDNSTANRYNVVFVMDGSGSMTETDSEGWRYEAIELFMGLLTDVGNNVGEVVFNEDIMVKKDIKAANGTTVKKEIVQDMRAAGAKGDTNIGTAVKLATEMLASSGNADLPSVIILLSDGNTDFTKDTTANPKKKLKESLADKGTAIETARANGYPVYSICLNKDKKANSQELEDISNSTGGKCIVINKASDLKNAFAEFYNLIYATSTSSIVDEVLPASGEVEKEFEVPVLGVEEVNIIVNNMNSLGSVTLFQPDGIAFSQAEIDKMKMETDSFSIIKIASPQSGIWRLNVKGSPKTMVKIDMVYNSSISINATYGDGGNEFVLGDTISVKAKLVSDGNNVEQAEIYQTYPAILILTNNENGKAQEIKMQAEDKSYTSTIDITDIGTYTAQIKVVVNEVTGYSKEFKINAGNKKPVADEYNITFKVTKLPFIKGDFEYDLSQHMSDPEGGELTYSIAQTSYDAGTVSVMDGMISIPQKGIEKGTVSVRVTDPLGASSEVVINIKVVDIAKIILIVLATIILLVLLAFIAISVMKNSKTFGGTIMVSAFDNISGINTAPSSVDPQKGKYLLRMLLEDGCGVDTNKGWFRATGKNYIYFESTKGYYTNSDTGKRSKKIQIDDSFEVIISNGQDLEAGIKVTFMPYNYN